MRRVCSARAPQISNKGLYVALPESESNDGQEACLMNQQMHKASSHKKEDEALLLWAWAMLPVLRSASKRAPPHPTHGSAAQLVCVC